MKKRAFDSNTYGKFLMAIDDFGADKVAIELANWVGSNSEDLYDFIRFLYRKENVSYPWGIEGSKKKAYEYNNSKDVWISDDEPWHIYDAHINYSDGMFGYANEKGYWELSDNGEVIVSGDESDITSAMAACDYAHGNKTGKVRK